MKLMHTDKPLFKVLNVTVLYSMLLNSFAPAAYATTVTSPSFGGVRGKIVPTFSMNTSHSADERLTINKPSETATVSPIITGEQQAQYSAPSNLEAIAVTLAGPGQGESSGFSLGSTDNMVDKFTGDFSYSIPLADVEGYPIVLNYNSNIGMNSEASWVGLGWELNVGAVSREMRGLPDEFNGEQTINRTFNQKEDLGDSRKLGIFAAVGVESPALSSTNLNLSPSVQITALGGKYRTDYLGIGKTFDFGLQASLSIGETGDQASPMFIAPSFGLGYSSDSRRGIGKTHSFGLSAGMESTTENNYSVGFTFGKNFNSRLGLTERTAGFNISRDFNGASREQVSAGYGTSTAITYGTATSVPALRFGNQTETRMTGLTLYRGKKFANWYYRVGMKVQTSNTLINRTLLGGGQRLEQPALGYFHSGKRLAYESEEYSLSHPLMDFNRSNDYEFSQNMTNLPFSIQAYDVFRVNAMGLGATFRGRRQDVGTYYDPKLNSKTDGKGVNVSLGKVAVIAPVPATNIEIGASGVMADGEVVSSHLGTYGTSANALEFVEEAKGNDFDSRVYFKSVGELTPEDMDDFNALGGTEPVRFLMEETLDQKEIQLTSSLQGANGFTGTASASTLNQKDNLVQATYYAPFTAEQYAEKESEYGFHELNSFPASSSNFTDIQRSTGNSNNTVRSENHLSAMEITNTSGMRYIFGIPAYNISSSQVSFCATGITFTPGSGICTYNPGDGGITTGDNTIKNLRGISNFYDRTDVPAYAHSFLLTEMLSSDYIDRTNDGPSLDDVGSYFKFNYTRVYGIDVSDEEGEPEQSPYKWKYPVGENKAMVARGLMGTDRDDIANYSYGEKEIWYIHTVESRNMVAEFHLLPREDAYGVVDENGVLDNHAPLYLLDKIMIYNRAERTDKDNGANAVPLQIIEFDYSYELCKNYPSNGNGTGPESGKLTLKGIRSYSGKSTEMGLYNYEFGYEGDNPDFSYDNSDAWGNYKLSTAARPNDLLPYPVQDEAAADLAATAWKLTHIQTPLHGLLEIAYEADNYATVQDERAMLHLDVKGLTNLLDLQDIQAASTWDVSTSTKLYKTFHKDMSAYVGSVTATQNYFNSFGEFEWTKLPNNVMVFKLDKTIDGTLTSGQAAAMLLEKSFTGYNGMEQLRELYLKLHIKVKGTVEEFFPTFCTISDNWSASPVVGVMPKLNSGADYEYGYIIIDPALVDEESDDPAVINSLQRSSLEFIRRNLSDVLYGTCPTCVPNTLLDRAVALEGEDVNKAMSDLGWAPEIITDYTSVRLYAASNKKYGGGARVQSLTYYDRWDALSSEYDGNYTWRYQYPIRNESLGNASFEPGSMIDECPLYKWDTYVNVAEKFPDETRFTPTPVTSLLFPTPIVGYESVRVDITGTENLGYSITEFHTSRTHPVIERTTILNKGVETNKPHSILTGKTTDRYGFSQGFFIHTNDFHGRPHQAMIYDVDELATAQPVLQSRSTYRYAGEEEPVKMSSRLCQVQPERVSLEYDMHADSRFIENSAVFREAGLTIRIVIIPGPPGLPPVVTFFPLPNFFTTSRTEAFYAHTFIKHLNTSAIVTGIETETFGSINSAENLVYDRQSGNVILSSLRDEYNDLLYSLSYPSHWGYNELMDLASAKNNNVLTLNLTATGSITDNVYGLLAPGDRVKITSIGSNPTVWIAKRNAGTINEQYYLMKGDGTAYTPVAGSHTVEIDYSNRDNRLNETMQSIVTKKLPLYTSSGNEYVDFAPTQILSASAVTYTDRNNVVCGSEADFDDSPDSDGEVAVNQTLNPYRFGIRGDLVTDAQYVWQEERNQAVHNYKTRFDGTYTTYTNFYQPNYQRWYRITHPHHPATNANSKWRKLGEALVFDQFGKLLETKNQIDVRSAVLYGYDRTLRLVPVAQAVNARQQEIAFDGFEDYTYYASSSSEITNTSPHFDFRGIGGTSVDATQRHSGFHSLKVNAGITASVTRAAGVFCDAPSLSDTLVNLFKVKSCNCIKDFEPTPGDYIISAWVRNDNPDATASGQIQVAVTGLSTLTFNASGPVIDGWQRIEGTFTVPAGGSINVTISLKNTSVSAINFDDLRIHPVLAGMTTTVYDPKTLLPVATHDGYNFTTFYNYDENLNLVRVRVETTEGIKTISETETGGRKQPKQP